MYNYYRISLLKVQVDTSHYPAPKNYDYRILFFFNKEKGQKNDVCILLQKIIYKHDSIVLFLLSSMETGVIIFSSCLTLKHTIK